MAARSANCGQIRPWRLVAGFGGGRTTQLAMKTMRSANKVSSRIERCTPPMTMYISVTHLARAHLT
eukprot:scaffold85266_cov33-Tisochrysis_lutea.AAC.2